MQWAENSGIQSNLLRQWANSPTTSPNPPVLAKGLISGLTKSIFMVDKKRNNSTFDVRIERIGKQLEALNHALHS